MGLLTNRHLTTPLAAFAMAVVVTLATRHAIGAGQRERRRRQDLVKDGDGSLTSSDSNAKPPAQAPTD
ncbi:hypothetical protein H4R34_003157 [Dimargaris verticillata]|uniref:Uncharacterized protein n=1 Tax=Dimargaris verticillata TaxID=2761393 RepID=A0A9W8B6S3_9FUNG|nr:hypothetical protein H4R34_003157 [Dimargaris verticillata]